MSSFYRNKIRVGVVGIGKIGLLHFAIINAQEAYLETGKLRAFAMSAYASGTISVGEAIVWISELPNLQLIAFGASSRSNIFGTRELARSDVGEVAA